ncbi:hypothetical protein ACPB9J_08715 [Streptomyces lavendulocolor]
MALHADRDGHLLDAASEELRALLAPHAARTAVHHPQATATA